MKKISVLLFLSYVLMAIALFLCEATEVSIDIVCIIGFVSLAIAGKALFHLSLKNKSVKHKAISITKEEVEKYRSNAYDYLKFD